MSNCHVNYCVSQGNDELCLALPARNGPLEPGPRAEASHFAQFNYCCNDGQCVNGLAYGILHVTLAFWPISKLLIISAYMKVSRSNLY